MGAWWETGHRTVARIAAAHLTPAARTRLARILSVSESPEVLADALAGVSTWADEVKGETKTGAWHYIDLTLQDQKSDIPERCKDDNCVTARIRIFSRQLASRDEKDRRWSELDSLRYLVHFVGDVHQPLHAASDADLGGNCERIEPPFNKAKNLHALWDGGIIEQMHRNDRELAADLDGKLGHLRNRRKDKLAKGDQDDWAWESHVLAEQVIYHKLHIPEEPILFPQGCTDAPLAISSFHPVIDVSYVNKMIPIVQTQLLKGGLRLAQLLNEAL